MNALLALKFVALGVLLLLVALVRLPNASAEDVVRPNVLIIHTDEHHFGTLGCYGGAVVKTPSVDFLAANGARCTSFYATTPVCSPSRAAMVSGMYPHNTPVVTNDIPLSGNIETFAAVLAKDGYATGYAGKWHLDGSGKPQWEPQRRFGFEDNRFMFNRGHWKKFGDTPEGPQVAARKNGKPTYAVDGADEKSFSTDWLTDKAIDFIETHCDGPFCYMVSFPDPHGPNTVRAPYDTMYADAPVTIPKSFHRTPAQIPGWGGNEAVSEQGLKRIMPQYYGMVKCIDDNVGRLLDTLRKHDLLGNTIVVFTSDHGDLCGEHHRLNKGVPYEGSAKVAMVVYYPARIPAGVVVSEAISFVDFKPTLLKLAGHQGNVITEGRDVTSLLAGKTPENWNDIAFLRGTGDWLCAVTDQYKLVISQRDTPWLFDLKADPDELVNRYDDPAYREVARKLANELIDYCDRHGDPRGEDPKLAADLTAAAEK